MIRLSWVNPKLKHKVNDVLSTYVTEIASTFNDHFSDVVPALNANIPYFLDYTTVNVKQVRNSFFFLKK